MVEHVVAVGFGSMPLDHVHFVLSYVELLLHLVDLLFLIRRVHM